MEDFKLLWNWTIVVLIAAAAVLFAIDLVKLVRQSARGASRASARKLIVYRAGLLLSALLLLGRRIDRLFMD